MKNYEKPFLESFVVQANDVVLSSLVLKDDSVGFSEPNEIV